MTTAGDIELRGNIPTPITGTLEIGSSGKVRRHTGAGPVTLMRPVVNDGEFLVETGTMHMSSASGSGRFAVHAEAVLTLPEMTSLDEGVWEVFDEGTLNVPGLIEIGEGATLRLLDNEARLMDGSANVILHRNYGRLEFMGGHIYDGSGDPASS